MGEGIGFSPPQLREIINGKLADGCPPVSRLRVECAPLKQREESSECCLRSGRDKSSALAHSIA